MDEMGHGWTDIAFLTDEQYREELAKRRAQRLTTRPPGSDRTLRRGCGPRRTATRLRSVRVRLVFCSRRRRSRRSAATTNGEWRAWGGDLGVTRYAPLDQINAGNFNKLADRLALQDREPRQAPRLQSADHAADGERRAVRHGRRAPQRRRDRCRDRRAAVDAPARGGQARRGVACGALSGRGVGYWTDGKGDERIFYVTIGYQLVGLDAKTGASAAQTSATTASSI